MTRPWVPRSTLVRERGLSLRLSGGKVYKSQPSTLFSWTFPGDRLALAVRGHAQRPPSGLVRPP